MTIATTTIIIKTAPVSIGLGDELKIQIKTAGSQPERETTHQTVTIANPNKRRSLSRRQSLKTILKFPPNRKRPTPTYPPTYKSTHARRSDQLPSPYS